jgi:hypothetical protein
VFVWVGAGVKVGTGVCVGAGARVGESVKVGIIVGISAMAASSAIGGGGAFEGIHATERYRRMKIANVGRFIFCLYSSSLPNSVYWGIWCLSRGIIY